MASTSAHRSALTLTLALWIGVVVVLGAARLDFYFRGPLLEQGDIAANALQVENAKNLRELYGNYSRFEFNHPGPAFFYVYAASEWLLHDVLKLTPAPGNAHLVASMALQAFFFAGAIALLARRSTSRIWLPLSLLLAALYFGLYRDAFVSIWPPHVLLMPFLFFLVVCVTLAEGDFRALPLAGVAGGFLFHGHVAQPMFVATLGTLALILGARREYRDNGLRTRAAWRARHARSIAVFAVVTALFLLPLFIDLLIYGTRGNVATIIGTFAANSSDKKSFFQSALYFLSFASSTQVQDELFTELGPQTWEFFKSRPGLYAAHAVIWFAPLWVLLKFPKFFEASERRFFSLGYLFFGATVALCLLWGRAQAGGMHHFNGFFYYGVYYFGFALGLAVATSAIRVLWPAHVSVAILCCAAVAATWSFRSRILPGDQSGLSVLQGIESALVADSSNSPKLLRFEHAKWPEAVTVALALKRRGLDVYVPPWWTFMFGRVRDETLLGPEPEAKGSNWWIAQAEKDTGIPLTDKVSLFVEPAELNPDGVRLEFGQGARGFRYLVSGLTTGNIDLAWTDLPRLTFMFRPVDAHGDVRIEFDAQTNGPDDHAQPAEVRFNGLDLGTVEVLDREIVGVTVPQAAWNAANLAVLELRFADARAIRTRKRPAYENWQAWGLWSVRFSTLP